ncbi:MAG TPA: SET domain-containing protein, partial [Polyangiaceae bacterium]|nr:SET domain-containing protein [Polyangiaceae bacterium]
EELTILYNGVSMAEFLAGSAPDDSWDARWTFDCRCGSPRCIRTIDRYVVVAPDDGNSSSVYLGVSQRKGRGVFARRPITAGEVFETAPVLVVPAAQWSSVEKTVFFDYTFEWGWDGEAAAIALGYGSLYNHSYTPNARYEKRLEDAAIDFVALRELEVGEEILINYNGKPEARDPLWFPVEG